MRVAHDNGAAVGHGFRLVVRVIDVTVCQEEDVTFINQIDVISHDGEFQDHLIDFGIAVASYGNNLISVIDLFNEKV